MKITEVITEKEFSDAVTIKFDGEKVFYVCDEETEDCTLGKDFNDCYRILNMLKKVYEVSKSGEKIIFESVQELL